MKLNLIKKLLLFFISFLILAWNIKAATIYGDIYNFELEKVNALVIINSTPTQKQFTNGSYSFDVPLGIYTLEAYYRDEDDFYYTKEIVEIKNEGNFRIDLILMPEEDLFISDPYIEELIDIIKPTKKRDWKRIFFIIFIIIIFLLIVVGIFFIFRYYKKKIKEKKEKERKEIFKSPDKFKEQVIKIIEKEKRILQKDLRKNLGVSEAKLSLLIAELEEEGKVKKIKRGRGNIIIWQE